MLKFNLKEFLINAIYYSIVFFLFCVTLQNGKFLWYKPLTLLELLKFTTFAFLFTPLLSLALESSQIISSKTLKYLTLITLFLLLLSPLFSLLFGSFLSTDRFQGLLDYEKSIHIIYPFFFLLSFFVWYSGKENSVYWGKFTLLSCLFFFLNDSLKIVLSVVLADNELIELPILAFIALTCFLGVVGFFFGLLSLFYTFKKRFSSSNLIGFFLNLPEFIRFLTMIYFGERIHFSRFEGSNFLKFFF